jgi:hypothetical protein
MDSTAIRTRLDALIASRGEDYASLSRLLGRNASYVQQFIKRGVPRRLSESDRHILASHFGIAEHLLGGPAEEGRAILLEQVATVSFAAGLKRGDAGYNGQPAVIVSVQKQPDADTVALPSADASDDGVREELSSWLVLAVAVAAADAVAVSVAEPTSGA